MRAIAARMDDALRNALVVEMEDLLAEMKIFEQRSARARPILSEFWSSETGPPCAVVSTGTSPCGDLVQFAALAAAQLLIVDRRRSGRRRFAGCLLG